MEKILPKKSFAPWVKKLDRALPKFEPADE